MKTLPSFPALRVRSWVAALWPTLVGTLLGGLALFLLIPSHTSPVPVVGPAKPLSEKALRRTERSQAARLDSIRREVQLLPRLIHTRDSALAVARRHNTSANQLLRYPSHEALAAPALSTQRLVRALANYQPGTYALDSITSIR
jgi:hypothetical protein